MLLGGCGSVPSLTPSHAKHLAPVHVWLRDLGQALVLYQADHNDTSPPVSWRPALLPYGVQSHHFESRGARYPYIFAHRATLIGKRTTMLPHPEQTAILIDVGESSDPFLAELPAVVYRTREVGGSPTAYIGFADGHMKPIAKTSFVRVK